MKSAVDKLTMRVLTLRIDGTPFFGVVVSVAPALVVKSLEPKATWKSEAASRHGRTGEENMSM